jgi:hypothetical protein
MEASCFESKWLSPAFILQIIQVNLTSDVPKPLTPGTSLEFTYSVRWEASTIPFAKRFERYLDYNFFEHQVTRCGGRVVISSWPVLVCISVSVVQCAQMRVSLARSTKTITIAAICQNYLCMPILRSRHVSIQPKQAAESSFQNIG